MIITVGTYSDMLAARDVLGVPRATFYRYIASPEKTTLVAIYEGDLMIKTNEISVDPPTPAEVLVDFPDAKELGTIVVG